MIKAIITNSNIFSKKEMSRMILFCGRNPDEFLPAFNFDGTEYFALVSNN